MCAERAHGVRRGVLQRARETTKPGSCLGSSGSRLRACHCSARACYRPCRAARGLGDEICRLVYPVSRVPILFSAEAQQRTDTREYFEVIVYRPHAALKQMYNNATPPRARRKTSGILRHRPLELASLGVEAAARLLGPRPEYVVSHKLAALPRLCTRASRHVHHLLFFCTRTALCSGCRSHQGDVCSPSLILTIIDGSQIIDDPIPSRGRVQSVDSPNLAKSRQISSSTRSRIARLGNHDRIARAAAGVATHLA